ncbi:hypothetical protein K1719_038179 [Acacia pycnantha]|nr:hypothetical protein K1719_038179 [Acacia pycnantha]
MVPMVDLLTVELRFLSMEDQFLTPLIWKETKRERILIGKEGFDVIEVTGNAFMFRFSEEEKYYRVLRGRPWSINGRVLNLLERSKYNSYEEFDFSRCPVWIQIHNVPMEAWCLENVILLGSSVGEVALAEDPFYKGSEDAEATYVKKKKEETTRRREAEVIQKVSRNPVEEEDGLFSIKSHHSEPIKKSRNLLKPTTVENLKSEVPLDHTTLNSDSHNAGEIRLQPNVSGKFELMAMQLRAGPPSKPASPSLKGY